MSNAKESAWNRYLRHAETKLRKRLRLGHSLKELEPSLVDRELYFRAPELTPDLLNAIQLISPQFHLRLDDTSRRFWELNQNGLCWGEYLALEPYLERLGTPSAVLDIGPGMGRSTIFFKQVKPWQPVKFHLYESTGESTKYTKAGPRFSDSFCGNLSLLEFLLQHHEIENYEIFDAADLDTKLGNLPGPYDFIYSFFAVGFHWSIYHFLDEILDLMTDRAIGAFTLHDRFTDYDGLKHLPHRIVDFQRSWPRDRVSKMLVLAKNEDALKGI